MAMFEPLMRVMTDSRDTLKIECLACRVRMVWARQQAFDRLGSGSGP